MDYTTAPMRWNGWGDPARTSRIPGALKALIAARLGVIPKLREPIAPGDVTLTGAALPPAAQDALIAAVGEAHVSASHDARLLHAGGKSTIDLLQRRQPTQAAPAAIVQPANDAEIARVLSIAEEHRLAVVPFGGGTSVVGGISPEHTQHRAVIVLDLARLSGLEALNDTDQEARISAGTPAPEAERLLAAEGFELGHYPQSFRYATIGGFAAARSSGQNSAGYGRFDAMVTGVRVVTPRGILHLGGAPGSAAGPDLKRLFLGSEGILGVITAVTLRVHKTPTVRRFDAWTFPNFGAGADALRQIAQRSSTEGGPTVIRLSDEAETAVSLAQVGHIGKAIGGGCSAVVLHEGTNEAEVDARRARTSEALRAAGGSPADASGAEHWYERRFDAPYLRDTLLDHGVFCETFETATTWSRLPALKRSVDTALAAAFGAERARHIALCHISHIYPTGASLYFTVAAGLRRETMLEAWHRVKAVVMDAIVEQGATLSHHHGVGRDHAPWLSAEVGEVGIDVLRAVKAELDPHGVLNPGVLVSEGT